MNNIEIITSVENGRFKRNINTITDVLNAFEGKTLVLQLKLYRKQRSKSQNSYYWAVIIPIWRKIIKDEWGEIRSGAEVHEFLKFNCNYEEHVDRKTGEILRMSKSTKGNTTTEQEDFHTACRQLAMDMFNVEIPLPDKQITINM